MSPPTTEYDLLTAPWIPALTRDGDAVQVGILPALRGAHELSQIADPSPVVTFGLYRLLTAIVRRYLPLSDTDAWAEAWDQGAFDAGFLQRVETQCAGKLRLFDAEAPFYQSADIALDRRPTEPLKSVGYLVPDASTGTNVAHFSHAGEARHAFCPACCAKGLVHLPAFALAGGAGIKPGINGVPPLYVLPRGESLFHTLLLSYPFTLPSGAAEKDPGPLWEASTCVEARKEKNDAGFVESLTWPPRRVRLFPGAGGECSRCGTEAPVLVRRMVFAQGWSRTRGLPLWRDPWAAYYPRKGSGDDQAELLPLRPTEQKDVWRDFPVLFLQEENASSRRPTLLDELTDRRAEGTLPADAPVIYEVFGLRTDMKAKIFEWRQDCFEFPPALLGSRTAARAIREALEAAKLADTALLRALEMLFVKTPALQTYAAGCRANEKTPVPRAEVDPADPLISSARRDFWQALEGEFRRALGDPRLVTAHENDRHEWTVAWRATVRNTGWHQLDAALQNLDGNSEGALRQVSARKVFANFTHSLNTTPTDAAKGGPA